MEGGRPKLLVVSGPNLGQDQVSRLLGGWFEIRMASAGTGESTVELIAGAADEGYPTRRSRPRRPSASR